MPKAIIINGSAECGKDKFIEYFKEYIESISGVEVFNDSTIDPSKKALEIIGWDGKTKSEEFRSAMVRLKQMSIHLFNGPFKYIIDVISKNDIIAKKKNKQSITFVHCREPEEIQKFVEHYRKDCHTLLLRSPRGKSYKNGADDVVENYDYDTIITNDKSLMDLKIQANEFARSFLI
jgi:hypothetical protein